jgi:hypothetical protein
MVRFLNEYYLKKTNPFQTSETNRNTFVVADKNAATPAVLGPALAVTPADIRTAITVLDRSLAWLRRRFAGAPITVVYVPSPLATYRLGAPDVTYLMIDDTGYHDRETDAARVAANSDQLCGLARDVAARQGTGFIDARPALRAAAATRSIHGPIDWLHFNHSGYKAFGELLAQRLADTTTVDGCR